MSPLKSFVILSIALAAVFLNSFEYTSAMVLGRSNAEDMMGIESSPDEKFRNRRMGSAKLHGQSKTKRSPATATMKQMLDNQPARLRSQNVASALASNNNDTETDYINQDMNNDHDNYDNYDNYNNYYDSGNNQIFGRFRGGRRNNGGGNRWGRSNCCCCGGGGGWWWNNNNNNDNNYYYGDNNNGIGSVTRTVSCSETVNESGQGTIQVIRVTLSNELGTKFFNYDAFDIPDRFRVFYNGNQIIDTGYVGSTDYNQQLNDAGYPSVSGPGVGTITFNHDDSNVDHVDVAITAPLSDTEWEINIPCTSTSNIPTSSPTRFFSFGQGQNGSVSAQSLSVNDGTTKKSKVPKDLIVKHKRLSEMIATKN